MKEIDNLVGLPICAALSAGQLPSKVLKRLRHSSPPSSLKTLVFIKLWGIGSLVQLVPTIGIARDQLPKAHIMVVTLGRNRDLIPLLPDVDQAIFIEDRQGPLRFARDILSAVMKMRTARPDVVFDFEFFVRFTAILTALVAAPIRIGFDSSRPWRSSLYTDVVSFQSDRHISESFKSFLKPLGFKFQDNDAVAPILSTGSHLAPRLAEPNAEVASAVLERNGYDSSRPLVLMTVNASELSLLRRWPPESFAQLADAIVERFDAQVWLVGSPGETEYTARVHQRVKHMEAVRNLSGTTTIEELAALAAHCDLFISNDSGPLHLAVAAGAPTISFFGPETPTLYGPQGDRHAIFYSGIACSPCLTASNNKTSHCQDNVCLQAISVPQVMSAVSRLLNRAPGDSIPLSIVRE
jgi:lipopolysaccharide heptosyltransferase II